MRKVLLLFYHEGTKFERVYAVSQGHVAVSGEARIWIQACLNWNPAFYSLPASLHDEIQEVLLQSPLCTSKHYS